MATIDLCLLDGDILRYEIGSIQQDHPFLEGERVPAPAKFIRERVDDRIEGIMAATGATHLKVFLTGAGNFRFNVATRVPYKGNRSGLEKPPGYETVYKHLLASYPTVVVEGIEADDALAIEQLKARKVNKELATVIASRDKDLRMTPGYHYSWACGMGQKEKPLYYITPDAGKKFFYKQLLTGDATDNIIGCGERIETVFKSGPRKGQPRVTRKGVGPKTAEAILQGPLAEKGLFLRVKEQYQKVFKDEWYEAMLENARLLYIGQTPDNLFNFPEELLNEQSESEQCDRRENPESEPVQSSADGS